MGADPQELHTLGGASSCVSVCASARAQARTARSVTVHLRFCECAPVYPCSSCSLLITVRREAKPSPNSRLSKADLTKKKKPQTRHEHDCTHHQEHLQGDGHRSTSFGGSPSWRVAPVTKDCINDDSLETKNKFSINWRLPETPWFPVHGHLSLDAKREAGGDVRTNFLEFAILRHYPALLRVSTRLLPWFCPSLAWFIIVRPLCVHIAGHVTTQQGRQDQGQRVTRRCNYE